MLTESQKYRVDIAEGRAYEALYDAAAETLHTGSQRIGDVTLIWHPTEDEAGYNCLVNFHLASDLDGVLEEGIGLLKAAGSPVVGVPIDERISDWATTEKLFDLGLSFQSDEVIWGRELPRAEEFPFPAPPTGIEIRTCDLPKPELQHLINQGWGLEADDPRGVLYSYAPLLPDWTVYVAWDKERVAGISVFCSYEQVGLLMLAVVLPDYRGRGLQTFFIAERLAESVRQGCTLAISETNDDNASPRNLQRAGFSHWITRQVYRKSI